MKTKKKVAPKGRRYSSAYKKAVAEIANDNVQEIKRMIVATLNDIRAKEESQKRLAEDLKFLRADIEDLKRGRIDKIRARHDKDTGMAAKSRIDPERIGQLLSIPTITSGVTDGSFWVAPQTYTSNATNVGSTTLLNSAFSGVDTN
jgi:hypothetical protein